MDTYFNVAIAQLNSKVGDFEGNLRKLKEAWEEVDKKAHLLILPELYLCGYPPEDLLLREDFLRECNGAFKRVLEISKEFETPIAVGGVLYEGYPRNALLLIHKGRVALKYFKRFLPNYSVFDEKRYFKEGDEPRNLKINGVCLTFSICEDIWHPDGLEREGILRGGEVIINVNASPFYEGKYLFKENFLKARAQDNLAYVVYVNMVGGQDELVFDGRSLILSPEGEVLARAKAFEEDLLITTLEVSRVRKNRLVDLRWRERARVEEFENLKVRAKGYFRGRVEDSPTGIEEIYGAILLGIRDYTFKNSFEGVILGISGGIDSSLCLCLCVDALGKDRVKALFMPSQFSSKESYEDARKLCKNLKVKLVEIPIREIFLSYEKELGKFFKGFDVADENLQARIRANLLFYFSNKENLLVIATSNKSETAVGYTTIYGDMAGGFAPIKDLYKTKVYELAHFRNERISEDIPRRVFEKPPSAELRENQKDQDVLPPYPLLDSILKLYVEEGLSLKEIVKRGYEEDLVKRVILMVKRAEYKRKQAPLGIKLTKRAFGKDWRIPVTNSFY